MHYITLSYVELHFSNPVPKQAGCPGRSGALHVMFVGPYASKNLSVICELEDAVYDLFIDIIDEEQNRAQHRPLWHPACYSSPPGSCSTQLDPLPSPRQPRLNPTQDFAPNSMTSQLGDQSVVRHLVKTP